jgi:putative endonuclease
MFYTYVLQSKKDKKYYTGWTKDIERRLREHNDGFTPSTKCRVPLELIYYEACLNEGDAKQREKYLKSGIGKRFLKHRLRQWLENKQD